jgi:hypothetical protein
MQGRMRHHDTPRWTPLEELLGADDLCAHFMWMHEVVLEDGTALNAYKHRWTRCYFHLTDDSRTFYYLTDGLYREVDPYTAIKAVFAQWERCEPTPEERKALRAALRRAAAHPERQ